MKKIAKLVILSTLILVVCNGISLSTTKAKEAYCTVGMFIKNLSCNLGFTELSSTEDDCYEQLKQNNIILEDDMINLSASKIKVSSCCELFERVLDYNKENYNQDSYLLILNNKRISDISQVEKNKRSAVIRCFSEGIISSESNGYYVQSRTVKANNYITVKEANDCIERLLHKDKRFKMSEDGQKMRTTNLPRNYKDFPYILETYPNKFYEVMFDFMNYDCSTYKPKKNRTFNDAKKHCKYDTESNYYYSYKNLYTGDYSTPATVKNELSGFIASPYNSQYIYFPFKEKMDINLYGWCNLLIDYIKLKYNVDYRKIDKTWCKDIDKLSGCGDPYEYIKTVKANKVIIKLGKVAVEPSTLYTSSGIKIRAYIQFKVISAKDLKNLDKVFYKNFYGTAHTRYKSLKKGEWKELIYDFDIGCDTLYYGQMAPLSCYRIFYDANDDYTMYNLMKGPTSHYKQVKIKSGENKGSYKWIYK